MPESENHGVQGLAFQTEGTFLRSIDSVAQQRMTDRCHMYADLVGAAGFETAFHIGICAESFQYLIMCDSRSAVSLIDSHLFPVGRMTADRGVHCAAVFAEISQYDRPVSAVDRMLFELLRQIFVRPVIFTDKQGTCCIPVNSVDDTGAQNAVYPGKLIPAVIHQGIHSVCLQPGRPHPRTECRAEYPPLQYGSLPARGP